MEEILKQIGLTGYEIRVFLTLLKFGSLNARMVSDKSKVPYGRIYDTVNELRRKGLISVIQGKIKLYKVVDPNITIKNILEERKKLLTELQEKIDEETKKIKIEKPEEKLEEKLTITSGRKSILNTVMNFFDTAKKEVLSITTYEVSPSFLRHVFRAIKRGVKAKTIVTLVSEKNLALIKEGMKRGDKLKYYLVPGLRLAIVDKEKAIVSVVNPLNKEDRVNIMIDSKDFADSLANYHDLLWEKAMDIKILLKK